MKAAALHRGSISVSFALMLAGVLAFTGLAMDLAQMLNRKQELQRLADAVALAAAQSLNGAPDGVADAVAQAAEIAPGYRYNYRKKVVWNDRALSFAAQPDAPNGDWKDVAGAAASPGGLRFARVDTSKLDGIGVVAMPFAALLGAAYASATAAAVAVAGRSDIDVAPLAICAMSAVADGSRSFGAGNAEWVQYGFRFGVTYNLLNLNPAVGATVPEYFLVAPQAASTDASDAQVAPFLCSGSMQRDSVTGATVTVRRPGAFTFSGHLNTRFGEYAAAAPCTARGAPPDMNIMSYAAPNWMVQKPTAAHAQPGAAGAGEKLDTVADRGASAPTAADYGALWAYGAAKRAGTRAAIAKSQWPQLYKVASGSPPQTQGTYPATSPYLASQVAGQFLYPSDPGRKGRRLLHIPLLACPVAAGASAQAQVLAVARFLLTTQASATAVSAEFAGVVSEQALGGAVELYR